jgi:hypothetical protein
MYVMNLYTKQQSASSDSMVGEMMAIYFTHQSTKRWRWEMIGSGGTGGGGIGGW